jgi:hypothetical protein
MRGILLSLLLCIVAFATGCPSGPSKHFPGNDQALKTKSLVSNMNAYLTQLQNDYNHVVDSDPAKAKRDRNDAIEAAMAVIDDNYTDYIRNIETQRSTTDFILDVVELGTGAATGITKGERPNQILGIALTAFRGARTSRELNFYQQKTTPILIIKMDDNRSKVLASMLDKKSKEVGEYSLKAAIRDMVAYYNAGTLVRAFTELGKDTSASAKASEALVRHVRGDLEVTDIPSIQLAQVIDQFASQEKSLAEQVRTAQKATPIPAAVDPRTQKNTDDIKAAQAARKEKLKPIRDKLDTIWNDIQGEGDKFSSFIQQLKSDAATAEIVTNIETSPDKVTEEDYLKLLRHLRAKVDKDLALNNELLSIIKRDNK